MKTYPTLRRWLVAGVAVVIVTVAVLGSFLFGPSADQNDNRVIGQPKNGKQYPWPLFGGSIGRNLVNLTDKNITLDFELDPDGDEVIDIKTAKHVRWLAELGSKSYGGPVIAEGKVFIGTNNENPRNPAEDKDRGVIMCFDEITGKFLWQKTYTKLPSGRVHDWPREGICSTPVIENGKMYYISNRCWVVCARTSDGEILWQLDMMKDLAVFPHNLATCSPLIVGNRLFLCTSNGVAKDHINIPAPKAPSFLALDKRDGKILWQDNSPTANLLKLPAGGNREKFIKNLVNTGKLLMHGQWANPAYTTVNGVDQIIFPGGDGWMRAFDPASGKLLWKFDCNPTKSIYELGGRGTRNDFVNTPVIVDNKCYIGVGQDPEHDEGVGHFWCIDLVKATKFGKTNADNDVTWKNDNYDGNAAVNKTSALAWHYGGVGKPAERIPGNQYVFGRTLSTACVHEGVCYIAELSGFLHVLDAKTGQRLWHYNTNAPIWSSPYFVDGKILLGNDDQYLYIFPHGRKAPAAGDIEERDMFGKVRATPVVANGTLYVMTENRLYAIRK